MSENKELTVENLQRIYKAKNKSKKSLYTVDTEIL